MAREVSPLSLPTTAGSDRLARAAVLSVFDLAWIEPRLAAEDVDVDDLTTFLSSFCERVLDSQGTPRWRLRDDERVRVLRTVPRAELRATLDGVATRPEDPIQLVLDQYLHDSLPRIQDLRPAQLTGVLQLQRWFGQSTGLPSTREVQARLDWVNLLAPLQRLLARGFIGRQDLLERLEDFVEGPETSAAFVIEGVGGSGKSTVLARLIAELTARDNVIAYVNFDRAWLVDGGPWALVDEIARQTALQRPDRTDATMRLRRQAQQFADRVGYSDVASRAHQQVERVPPFVMAELNQLVSPRSHLVIMFDTLEELARRESGLAYQLSQFVRDLATYMPGLKIIASGRALPRFGFDVAERWQLTGLGQVDGLQLLRLLTTGTTVDDALLSQIVRVLGGNPLSLQLAADVLNRTGTDPTRLIAVGEGEVQGQLYSRLLEHIKDPRVRAVAHPGLVVRRLTPDVIREVLAKPCGIAPLTASDADQIFWALQQEATLCEPSTDGDGALVHRADVRALMLPSIQRDLPGTTHDIHEAAVRFYEAKGSVLPLTAGLTDRVARREELYHRLMLKQERPELDRRWVPSVADDLAAVIDEMPVRSQLYLTSRIRGLRLDPAVRAEADDDEWCHSVRPAAEVRLERGQVLEALALVQERRARDGRALLPDLEIEALERLGRVAEALELAERERARASSLGHDRRVRELIAQEARILERMLRWNEAWSLLEALAVLDRDRRTRTTVVDQQVRLRELVVLTSLLRIARHQRRSDAAVEEIAAETVELAEATPARMLMRTPSLLRDLAAEVGSKSRRITELATLVRGSETERDGGLGIDGSDSDSLEDSFRTDSDTSQDYLDRGDADDGTVGLP